MRLRIFQAYFLLAGALIAAGFVGALWIAHAAMMLSAGGFLLALLGWAVNGGRKGPIKHQLEPLPRPLHALTLALIALALVSLVALFVAAVSGGVPSSHDDLGLFAEREVYQLRSHGQLTHVSRAHYVGAGLAFLAAWHALAEVAVLLGLGFAYRRARVDAP